MIVRVTNDGLWARCAVQKASWWAIAARTLQAVDEKQSPGILVSGGHMKATLTFEQVG